MTEKIIATLPFKEEQCKAIVAMPISSNFMNEMIGCVKFSLGIKMFDLLGLPGFSRKFSRDSKVILDTINLAIDKHFVDRVVIFQNVDLQDEDISTRFVDQLEEDYHHKRGLIDSSQGLKELYPNIEVTLIYARLAKNQSEIIFSEIFEDGSEEIRLRAPYLFKGITKCETTVIQCLDYRFRAATRTCIQDGLNINHFNLIGLPGSAKSFLEESNTAWKGVEVAYKQHSSRSFIIVHHSDCGAYGGKSKFFDTVTEEEFHREQLRKFKGMLLDKYLDINITLVYIRLIANRSKMQFVIVD